VSVITVVKNGGVGFMSTARSILAQTAASFEWVVKDCLSVDGTAESALALKDPRLRFVSAHDSGIYDGMNQALRLATGRYVHFLNAGDWYLQPWVLARFEELVRKQHDAALIVCSHWNQRRDVTIRYPSQPNRFYLYRRCFCHQAVFFSAELLADVGAFDTSLRAKADHDLILRCLKASGRPPVVVPEQWIGYEGGGFTDQKKRRYLLDVESAEVHRRHFSRTERVLFRAVQEATLWRVRRIIAEQERCSSVRSLYQKVKTLLNRIY
jgi:glycosyltransferase involved in cell wall biosynthesis